MSDGGDRGNKEAMEAFVQGYPKYVAIWNEAMRPILEHAQAALKGGMLINGGGAVALLAFLGSVWSQQFAEQAIDSLSAGLIIFSFGVVVGGLGMALIFFANELAQTFAMEIFNEHSVGRFPEDTTERTRRKFGRIVRAIIACMFISLTSFPLGVYFSYDALFSYFELSTATDSFLPAASGALYRA